MHKHKRWIAGSVLILSSTLSAAGSTIDTYQQTLVLGTERFTVTVPQGYQLSVFSTDIPRPRMLSHGEVAGEVLVGSGAGAIYRLTPPDYKAQRITPQFRYPHSVLWHEEALWVASSEGVYRTQLNRQENQLEVIEKVFAMPASGGHSSRTLVAGPDGSLYVSIGISGNCSNQYLSETYAFNERRGGVWRLQKKAGRWQADVFSNGLRNPVGLAWSPHEQRLYATNNGPDHLGFEQPPEQLVALSAGSFHGMPWYQYDGEQVFRDRCQRSQPPQHKDQVEHPVTTFPARQAPLGLDFVPEQSVYGSLSGQLLVAFHGSWAVDATGSAASRRPPKITALHLEDGAVITQQDIVSGFQLDDGQRWARPVDLLALPDGSILFSSDGPTSAIFKLTPIP